jgi:serine/threonine protein phosphatase PrpC
MEDTHAAVLHLEGGSDQSHETNSFFAVYDGHGGECSSNPISIFVDIHEGAAVAKFAADNVHQKLVLGEDYREKQYEAALKRAFLATDEDLLASKFEYYNDINLRYIVSLRLSQTPSIRLLAGARLWRHWLPSAEKYTLCVTLF